jgi:hypothetical protein
MALKASDVIRTIKKRSYRLSTSQGNRKNPTKKMAEYVSENGLEYIYIYLEGKTGRSVLRIHPRHRQYRDRLRGIDGVESERETTASSNMRRFPRIQGSHRYEYCGIPFTFESEAALIEFLDEFENICS